MLCAVRPTYTLRPIMHLIDVVYSLAMVKGFGVDDYTMVVTLLFFTGYTIAQIGGAAHGTGVSREKLTDASAQTALHF